MLYDARCPNCGDRKEVSKPMTAPMPPCAGCGVRLVRVWSAAAPVHYRTAGFYATDVAHFEKQVGTERAAKFRREKDDIERRAKAGRLTDYEKALEVAA